VRRLLPVLCAIVFVDTTFYAVVAPLLPHYAGDLHLSKASAGLLLAAYPAGTLAGALPSGLLAARIGPRRTVVAGLALLGASSVAFAFASSAEVLDGARFVQGIAGACSWAGCLSWLVVEAPPERRGELIGTVFGAAIGGSLLGPVLGAAAVALGTRPVFGALAAVALVLAGVAARSPGGRRSDAGGATLRQTVAARRVRLGMWLVAVPGLGFGVIDVLVPLRLDELGAGQVGIAATFLVAAVGEGLLSPVVGRVADRFGPLRPIRVGLVGASVLVVLIPAAPVALLCAVLRDVLGALDVAAVRGRRGARRTPGPGVRAGEPGVVGRDGERRGRRRGVGQGDVGPGPVRAARAALRRHARGAVATPRGNDDVGPLNGVRAPPITSAAPGSSSDPPPVSRRRRRS
jgi:MFS family permease